MSHKRVKTQNSSFKLFGTDKSVGADNETFFIAEGGNNHQGSLENAKKLIDMAVLCGCDCIKFQRRTVDAMLTKAAREAPYSGKNAFGPTYGEHRKAVELKDSDWVELKKYADSRNILFTASGWDEEAIDFLDNLGVPFFKMASADLTNIPLMIHTAKKGKPMFISTGMSNLDTVKMVVKKLEEFNVPLVIMHCVSTYPCDATKLNLTAIHTLIDNFPKHVIGYSGHESGTYPTCVAVVLGAKVVERHITLDRAWPGSDHAASLEFDGLRRVVRDIRLTPKLYGTGKKELVEGEAGILKKLGKSLVSRTAIKKGTKITEQHLTQKSPGNGIPPMRLWEFVGKTAACDIEEDVTLKEEWFN